MRGEGGGGGGGGCEGEEGEDREGTRRDGKDREEKGYDRSRVVYSSSVIDPRSRDPRDTRRMSHSVPRDEQRRAHVRTAVIGDLSKIPNNSM